MKATSQQGPEVFRPVVLTLTFETQTEVNTFKAVMSHTNVWDALRTGGIDPEEIRDALREVADGGSAEWLEVKKILSHP